MIYSTKENIAQKKNDEIKKNTSDFDLDVDAFITFMKAKSARKNPETQKYEKKVTHTLMGLLHKDKHPYRGSFSIMGKEYNKFLKLYKSVLGKIQLFIVERPKETGKMVGPLIIDIDYKTEDDERAYDIKLIKLVTSECNDQLIKYLNIDPENLIAYIQEKKEPTFDSSNKNYKDGFHIFYDIPLSYNKRKFLFDKIKDQITKKKLFDDIDTSSSYDQIVDESVLIDNGFLMFGSTKIGRDPYELTHAFSNVTIDEYPIHEFDNDDLVDIFALQKYTDDDDTDFIEQYQSDENELENMELHTKEKDKEKQQKNNEQKKQSNTSTNIENTTLASVLDISKLSEDHNIIYQLVNIMTIKRATEFESWIRVCWALHGICASLYKVFVHFSKKAKNFNEASCAKVWDDANRVKSGFTEASIRWWAKEDNEKEYLIIKYSQIAKLMERIKTPNDNDIADFITELYGDIYKCTSITKNTWYEFQEHRWVPVDSAYTLSERLATEVALEFTKGYQYMLEEKNKTNGMTQDDSMNNISKLFVTIGKLKDLKSSTTYVRTCARKMYDRKFEETLDSNPYLLGFDNGVFDLRINKFRNGEPDDRLTMTVGYKFSNKQPSQKILNEINDFIKKIQPEDDMLEYLLRFFASCLDGKNRDQAFRIFTGSGGNGKSMIIKLFELSLGEYYGTMPSSVLTLKDSGANSASPFMAAMRGKRAVGIYETESDATLQLGKMKGLTGGDKITTRKNFGDPFEFLPQFKMFVVCNVMPRIPSTDEGTWRRIRGLLFSSKFVAPDKVDESKHHYLRDTSLDDEKLAQWSSAFMWVLLNEYYPKYIKEGLCEPDKVKVFTEKYRKDSDIIWEFLSLLTIETKNDKDCLDIVQLYKEFKEWLRQNYNNIKCNCARKDLEDYLVDKRELQITNSKVYGLKSRIGDVFVWDSK